MKNHQKVKEFGLSKIFFSITIIVLITVILMTIPYQIFIENKIDDILNDSIQNSLKQISYSAGYMHTNAL